VDVHENVNDTTTVACDEVACCGVATWIYTIPVYLVPHAVDARLHVVSNLERRHSYAAVAACTAAGAVLVLVVRERNEVLAVCNASAGVVDVEFAVVALVEVCVSVHPNAGPVDSRCDGFAWLSEEDVVELLEVELLVCVLVDSYRL